jgi:hypothetical protein
MNILRTLVESLAGLERHPVLTVDLGDEHAFEHVHKYLGIVAVRQRGPPGKYSTVSITSSLDGMPLKSLVISGVTMALPLPSAAPTLSPSASSKRPANAATNNRARMEVVVMMPPIELPMFAQPAARIV